MFCCSLFRFSSSTPSVPDAFEPSSAVEFVPNFASAKVISVYDGDTFTVATWEGTQWCKFKVRIYGIDCPEMRTQNPAERRKAEEAKHIVETALTRAASSLRLVYRGMDKYGRFMCDVFLPDTVLSLACSPPTRSKDKLLNSMVQNRMDNHVSLSLALLSRALAVTYKGEKKNTVNWIAVAPYSANATN